MEEQIKELVNILNEINKSLQAMNKVQESTVRELSNIREELIVIGENL
ncbi:hypothetical protein M0R04_11750 [Candidatus Dojkabacteria bacterium]|jgi:dsDNA-specific endonuclease/ATPase MutS2|nr:hypothetical protein [Candidatus Dojkabacteria bacterium]